MQQSRLGTFCLSLPMQLAKYSAAQLIKILDSTQAIFMKLDKIINQYVFY